jgi:hypothetical protein
MSALLVEKMRHEKVSKRIDEDNNATICTLMEDSIADLQERHTNIIQRINDHLDELMIEVCMPMFIYQKGIVLFSVNSNI